ncbi:hypothetical protein [Desulfosporosinus metallidurans]|uniref:Uncharacterized protein n=1 Tax=Desulfosporosinus metallidurans TaxID=1888891 RepID=A0A1Q8R2Z2_9FIRM|nr:hypothetical protein [Desulfosporosinus metallidurans]OLN33840.1 hypothetical protein DSOL_0018 [Desulfosporosinus metallidurans]
MIKHMNKYYFVKPVDFRRHDTEFEVFNSQGLLMGTTVRGISPLFFQTEKERENFEEFILDETMDIQAQVKFLEEYGVYIEEVQSLNLELDTICENMDLKWNIPQGQMQRILTKYV